MKGILLYNMKKKYICSRYATYIYNEITTDCIAPIRSYWITDILNLIPADFTFLSKHIVEKLID